MDGIEIADTWKFCSSTIATLDTIKKIPPTNNIIPVEISTLVERSALDEYNDPTDELIRFCTGLVKIKGIL